MSTLQISKLTTAARSSCPGAPPDGLTPPPGRGAWATDVGLGAEGTGGFPCTFSPPGLAATTGFGFVPTAGAGGLFASELPGRELAGLESLESCKVDDLFQEAADPFDVPMLGKAEAGLVV